MGKYHKNLKTLSLAGTKKCTLEGLKSLLAKCTQLNCLELSGSIPILFQYLVFGCAVIPVFEADSSLKPRGWDCFVTASRLLIRGDGFAKFPNIETVSVYTRTICFKAQTKLSRFVSDN